MTEYDGCQASCSCEILVCSLFFFSSSVSLERRTGWLLFQSKIPLHFALERNHFPPLSLPQLTTNRSVSSHVSSKLLSIGLAPETDIIYGHSPAVARSLTTLQIYSIKNRVMLTEQRFKPSRTIMFLCDYFCGSTRQSIVQIVWAL